MLDRIARTIDRYHMFSPGQRVGVAVSGGADSVCLLHVLVELAPRWALKLSVLHLDHRLRGSESERDAEFAGDMAARLGLAYHGEQCDIARLRTETGDNLEQAARQARREFFLRFIHQGLLDRVALGHTRSDQAETVLLRFLRGSGTAGISGILPVTAEGFVRPLLEIDREEARRWLRERNIPWREDSSNQDPRFARNRIRHELLPALERDWNPALSGTLARMATLALDEEEYWNREIDRLEASVLQSKPPAILLRTGDLAAHPRPVARRLIRRAILRTRGDLRRIEFSHVEDVLALAGIEEGHGRIQLPGVDVMRSFDWLRLAPSPGPSAETRNYRFALAVPGHLRIQELGLTLRLEIEEPPITRSTESGYNTVGCALDWLRVSGPLEVRNWRPGDQYRPVGFAGTERIKQLFQKARVPLWERRGWPVITSGDSILWAWRFGPAARYAATAESRCVLTITEEPQSADSRNPADTG